MMAKWIPAADRLPKPLEDVIVAAHDPDAKDGAIVDLGFYARRGGWLLAGIPYIALDVRYWQPLPKAPKDTQDETP